MNISGDSIIVLPHLDDEFALVPLIKSITNINSKNLKVIYCAERIFDPHEKKRKRRNESFTALKLLGCLEENITYLNDSFEVIDLQLSASAKNIYSFIENLYFKKKFDSLITLNFEGGHPDHDALALIVDKFTKTYNVESIYVPSYNYRKTLFLPISVFRPLESQVNYFFLQSYGLFCWADCLRLAWIYKTERKAFIKLLPFILYKYFFSKNIYYSNVLNIESVDWEKSLSKKRYNIEKKEVLNSIKW